MEFKRPIQIGEYERNDRISPGSANDLVNNILDVNFRFDSIKMKIKIVNWGTVPHF